MFKNNMGNIDRILRFVVGAALLVVFFMYPDAGLWRWFALIGIIPLVTSVVGSCPLYTVFGWSTCPAKKS